MDRLSAILEEFKGENDRDTFQRVYHSRSDSNAIAKYGKQALADAEHYAFARSYVKGNPWMLPSILLATTGYYTAKKLGLVKKDENTSEPSIDQLKAGILGAISGFRAAGGKPGL